VIDIVPGPIAGYGLRSTRQVYRGNIVALRVDEVEMPGGRVATREVVEQLSAVAIVALDTAGRVALIRQYRHAVGGHLIELPAGLLDVPGELPQATAARELDEEAALRAATWHTLADLRPSPGLSTEVVRIYLARDLSSTPDAERHLRQDEEAGITVLQVDLDEAAEAALAGRLLNGIAVAGVLAAVRARDRGWAALRPADAPWPSKPAG
jgi:8-oxo-dGTP pyrophosphatase MutT (NUDIX family)